MAKEKDQDQEQELTISERVRQGAPKFLRNLTLVAAVVGLLVVAYYAITGQTWRDELKTVEETLTEYTNFVSPYVGSSPARPDFARVDDFLSFFDETSRDFFRENAEALARQRLQFEDVDFETLSDREIRSQAMLNVVNRPPLSGIARIEEQQPQGGGEDVRVTVIGRRQIRTDIVLHKRGDLWYMRNMGGLKSELEQAIAPFKEEE